ncbi:MAG: glycosyltransferase, partial [Thermoflexales bacterium]|nr:glycosyltransferase [Thermoflexales bacterium]
WLLFTDADISFAEDYFDRLSCIREDERLGLIYGVKDTRDEYVAYHRWFAHGQRVFARLGIPAATGSNLLIRRDVFEQVGGFDLSLTCNEDSEIAWRVCRAGYRGRFAPELRVYSHDHRRLRKGVLRKVVHSSVRCALLYLNLMPSRWRTSDWGYWSRSKSDHLSA